MAAAAAGGMPTQGGPAIPRPPMPMGGPGQVPMTPQPQAGGPTAPGNINSMLQTNAGNAGGQPGSPQRQPLPPWGDSQGTSDPATAGVPMMGSGAAPPESGSEMGNPAVLLKLLKSMGLV